MKRTLTAVTAAVLLAGLAGCGGTTSEPEAVPAPAEVITMAPAPKATGKATPARASGAEKKADASKKAEATKKVALTKAAKGYSDAYLAGDAMGMTGYLHPTLCDDQNREDVASEAARMQSTANGATMKITSVYVEGKRGGIDGQEVSADASDALRRLVKSWDDGKRHYSWRWLNGEWYLAGPCLPVEEYEAGA